MLPPSTSPATSPLLILGSVTPVYANNPSFRVFQYDNATKELVDYAVYRGMLRGGADPPVWSLEYTARAYFGLLSLRNSAYGGLATRLASNESLFARFQASYKSGTAQPPCDSACRADWACLLSTVRAADYAACTARSKPAASHAVNPATIAAPLAAAVTLVVLGLMCLRRRRDAAAKAAHGGTEEERWLQAPDTEDEQGEERCGLESETTAGRESKVMHTMEHNRSGTAALPNVGPSVSPGSE